MDTLVLVDTESFAYDAIGNPTTYRDGMSFIWQYGRQMATATKNGVTSSYVYNRDGGRHSKTVGGVTTQFYSVDGVLYGQKTGTNSLVFLYDEAGTPYGFKYNSTPYYYNYRPHYYVLLTDKEEQTMKNHKKWLSVLAIVATVGLLVCWYIADTPYRQARQLIEAIEAEDIDRVREMLESGVDPNELTASELGDFLLGFVESSASQPVSEACFTGNVELVRLMLEYGASANANEIADWSPIEGVLRQYDDTDLEMLQLLVEYGADTTYQGSEFSYEPVFEAARMWPITDDGYSEDDAKGITELVIYLLGDRSVNIQDERNGDTLLFAAVPSGNFYLVNYLIDHGADVHIVNHYCQTAYSYAMKYGYTEIAELLKP